MSITFKPLSDHTGVEVEGLDLSQPLSSETQERVYRAWLEHSVLVVRDQNLNPHELLAAAKQFGDPLHQHNTRFQLEECPEIHYISIKTSTRMGVVIFRDRDITLITQMLQTLLRPLFCMLNCFQKQAAIRNL